MNGAGGGFEERRLFVSQIMNLVQLLLLAEGRLLGDLNNSISLDGLLFDVLGKSTILCDAACLEVLAKQRLSSSTVETRLALGEAYGESV